MMRRVAFIAAVCVGLTTRATAAVTEVHYVMGTYLRLTVDGDDSPSVRTGMRQCFATARALDARFTRFNDASELSRLNASAESSVAISPDMAAMLTSAEQLRVATRGTFDVTAGALTQLWRNATIWPRDESVARARTMTGEGAFTVVSDRIERRPGVVIDLDGIAKGWAVDRCIEQLRAAGIARALVSFGESSLYGLGAPRGARGWSLSLRGLGTDTTVGTLSLRDQAASISAVFGHERRIGTRRVGHIVDPRTGQPLTTAAAVAVVASSATAAEAFSKALLIDRHAGDAAIADGTITGAVLERARRIERIGQTAFQPFAGSRRIAAAAEPLR